MILNVSEAWAKGYLKTHAGLFRGTDCKIIREVDTEMVEVELTAEGPRQGEKVVVDRSCLIEPVK